MPDIKDILAKAKPREHTVPICLAGDVAAEVERLEAELAATSSWQQQSLAEANPGIEIAEKIKDARERMAAAEVPFTFRALGAKAWSDLVAEHPGKTPEEAWDDETLAPALVAACAIDPVMTPEDVDALFETLNLGQRQELINAAWSVNSEGTSVPFALHASAILASHTGGK
ncbi:hypothetical protein SCAB_61201 [Streptomyces scabiei 87.22]|uniref:Uncharacterized protein n=1 Tax=Streptomyces scabiei (strain 87.22) TaxID=680198 RepID=C9Z952_STRSW|nr:MULTISPECIES: hypothetical protein [Streptomyces]MBP5875655.1 hypothetical protein [Streptomyces sp. LBUM 1477]MDX2652109.1 hypothetical protein [Streptomyces scabiei]MDX2725865.1 hypothetical protein [Streptomyces scabiei]MDX2749655.1 hypothetical protein [Streptomyces scabiei]MDX2863984.1 hypothetical protein [Streptomyces scabiei]